MTKVFTSLLILVNVSLAQAQAVIETEASCNTPQSIEKTMEAAKALLYQRFMEVLAREKIAVKRVTTWQSTPVLYATIRDYARNKSEQMPYAQVNLAVETVSGQTLVLDCYQSGGGVILAFDYLSALQKHDSEGRLIGGKCYASVGIHTSAPYQGNGHRCDEARITNAQSQYPIGYIKILTVNQK